MNEHNALYTRAVELVRFTTTMVPPIRLSWLQRWRVRRGVRLLERVVALNPQNWAAFWVMGKARQANGECESALEAFLNSHRINPEHPDVAREASISALECSKHELGIALAERAWKLNEADPGLRANLALAYLFSKQPQRAKTHIEEAYAKDPNDQITAGVRKVIDEVIAGKRPCPQRSSEL